MSPAAEGNNSELAMHTHTPSLLPPSAIERNLLDFNGEEKPVLSWR